eukprot:621012-Rhodomonas_salina.2
MEEWGDRARHDGKVKRHEGCVGKLGSGDPRVEHRGAPSADRSWPSRFPGFCAEPNACAAVARQLA